MITALRNLPAPAKLNLFLHVTGRRPDGYHLLETVFQLIDLADRIDLEQRSDGAIVLETPLKGVPAEQDLTVRAARRLAEHSGCRKGVTIRIDKHIPMGGGLGGGSSDAATVLMGLNRLWGLSLTRRTLMRIGLELGADVPFFIFGRTAYATGIGERLQICPQPPRAFALLAPATGVATAGVFSAPELTRDTKPIKIFGLSRGNRVFSGRNDLQDVVFGLQPGVKASLSLLCEVTQALGLDASHARMTGSGSCVFVPVEQVCQAESIVRGVGAMPGAHSMRVWSVRSLETHPLREWALSARHGIRSG
jgi:4-diphosphocytidyl-2-C-methyl-D-erythritol kinase